MIHPRILRGLMLRFPVIPAALLVCSCTTMWAEVHGPAAGVGIEMDDGFHASPTFTLGYQYDKWKDALGFGGGARVTYSPLNGHRVDLAADTRVFGFPPFLYLSPFEVSLVCSHAGDTGWMGGFEVGLGALFHKPPAATNPDFFDSSPECEADYPCHSDVSHPDYLPRAEYRVSVLMPFEDWAKTADDPTAEFLFIHHLEFSTTFSHRLLLGE